MENYTAKRAAYDEVPGVISLSRKFYLESNYNGITKFNPLKLEKNLFNAWASKEFVTICIFNGSNMVGFAHVTKDDFATDECTGSIYQMFIDPDHRGTGAARVLRDAIEAQFDAWGCVLKYAECGCGFDDPKNNMLFSNLWAKIGYQFLGSLLFKRG